MNMSLYELMALRSEFVSKLQDEIYSDPSKWHIATPVKLLARLKCILRYAKILQARGLLKADEIIANLKILEPGCGIGAFSVVLAVFGEVFSFDYSKEGVKTAKTLFGNNKSIKFIEGDGTKPKSIPGITNEKFNFIIIREFYPLSRIIVDNPEPIEVIREYYDMLREGGLIIIEHALEINSWRRYTKELQVSKIVKEFKADIFDTFFLDLILNFLLISKNKKLLLTISTLFHPFVLILCLFTTKRISKTIIIQK